jgi:hypothetical protein
MDLIGILVALIRAAWPLPNWSDRASVVEFAGRVAGAVWDLRDQGKLVAEDVPALCGAARDQDVVSAVIAEIPEANGEYIRKFLSWLVQALPYILPLILKPAPAPLPGPVT